jgi:hypothetical protein
MMTLRLLVLACPVLLLGCGVGSPTEKDRLDSPPRPTDLDSQSANNHLDSKTRAVFAEATKVEVFRLDGKEVSGGREGKPKEGKRLGGFLVTAQGQDKGREFARKLLGILNDDKTYTDEFAKCFWPGVAFRVWKDQEVIEVLICFRCHNFYCGPHRRGWPMRTRTSAARPAGPTWSAWPRRRFPTTRRSKR